MAIFAAWNVALLVGERGPRHGPVDLAGAECPEGVREVVGWTDVALHIREAAADQAQILDPFPAFRADGLPAFTVPPAVTGDVVRRRLQREVRRR